MPPRHGSPYSSVSFGPGPVPSAIKALIYANIAMFVAVTIAPSLTTLLGFKPASVVEDLRVWQLVTYMFMHGGIAHILFNMLALWMFGSELERTWGTRFFLKYYFITGIGAALLTLVFSLVPAAFSDELYYSIIIGASGAIYGVLLAYALYFPDRPIYLYFIFPIPAKYFVMIVGALAFYSSLGQSSGVANATHLGGLLIGYVYLKGLRLRLSPWAEVKYRYIKWKLGRSRKKFDVYQGGREDDWNRRVH